MQILKHIHVCCHISVAHPSSHVFLHLCIGLASLSLASRTSGALSIAGFIASAVAVLLH